jgi:aspartate racemase
VGTEKIVGVIGGLGPDATLDFYARLLEATAASCDQEHLRVIIYSNPKIPDRNRAVAGAGVSPGPDIAATASALERAGAELLCMPCNTAHAFLDELAATTKLPFISIVDAALAELQALPTPAQRVGLLCAEGGRRARVYEKAFERIGIDPVSLDDADQAVLMQLIYGVKAGRRGETERRATAALARTLVARGAQAVIAGCTEVPLLMSASDISVPFVDSTAALARAVVRAARDA